MQSRQQPTGMRCCERAAVAAASVLRWQEKWRLRQRQATRVNRVSKKRQQAHAAAGSLASDEERMLQQAR